MKKSQCAHCGKELVSLGPRLKKWCDSSCRSAFRYSNDLKYAQRNTYSAQVERSKMKKLKAIALKGGSCVKCGQSHPAALCFHHLDPSTKSFTIDGRVFGNFKWDKIAEELKKCELLCYNCHQITHFASYWEGAL
jgi:hypothetical protein